jgi:hypothetical protein
MATDDTENNRGTVRHSDCYENSVEVIEGSGFVNSCSRDQPENTERFLIEILQMRLVHKEFNM